MNIRNFCIIAHIDHGKSTLADRFLEFTGTVEKREMKNQLLDQMDLEREKGITIKLQPVRMNYQAKDGSQYILNLIDTPGHVDFSYEVSRSLAAVEGAILLVDATQGIQAQTLANLYLASEQNLKIIPVANKADLPSADLEGTARAIHQLIGDDSTVYTASGKTGQGVEQILEGVVDLVPSPQINNDKPLRAIIFDSNFDDYRGAIAYVRIVDGKIKAGDKLKFMATREEFEVQEVGYFKPSRSKSSELTSGEIGYVVTGLKEVKNVRVGDTIANKEVKDPLPGYKEMKSMVYAGIFCKNGDDYPTLRDAFDRLKLSDASLQYETEHSPALGYGFRCGFLGMLHLEIIQERLRREFDLDLIVTAPSVAYKLYKTNSEKVEIIKSAQELPDPTFIKKIEEPIMSLEIITPMDYIGSIMQFAQDRLGEYIDTEYLDEMRPILKYTIPLSMMLVDFYDKLKSISSGYASMNYDLIGYREANVVKLDILIAEEKAEALSSIVYRDHAYRVGRNMVDKLKELLPRQQFMVKIQAAVGGKIVAGSKLSALRKDVTAKLYGGDVTRKRKLLEKQKKGKKKMRALGAGSVDISQDTYMKLFKR